MNRMNYIYCLNIKELRWSDLQQQKQILQAVELADLEQFKFEKDKCRTLIGKMLLLYALQGHECYQAHYLPIIRYGEYGKPSIDGMKGHFNISHAQDWVVCVYSDGEVGIDIEYQVPIDISEYQHVMTTNEYQKALNDKQFDFFQLWTLKEAIMKAQGMGFYLSPTSFELSLPFCNDDTIEINHCRWFLFSQCFANDYRLSVASLLPIVGHIEIISLTLEQIRQYN